MPAISASCFHSRSRRCSLSGTTHKKRTSYTKPADKLQKEEKNQVYFIEIHKWYTRTGSRRFRLPPPLPPLSTIVVVVMSSLLFCGLLCCYEICCEILLICAFVYDNRPTVHFVRDAFAWSCWLFYVYLYIIYSRTLRSKTLIGASANALPYCERPKTYASHHINEIEMWFIGTVHTRVLFTHTDYLDESIRWINFRIYDKFNQRCWKKATRKIHKNPVWKILSMLCIHTHQTHETFVIEMMIHSSYVHALAKNHKMLTEKKRFLHNFSGFIISFELRSIWVLECLNEKLCDRNRGRNGILVILWRRMNEIFCALVAYMKIEWFFSIST